MLTGTAPFPDKGDALQTIHSHIARPPPPLPGHLGVLAEIITRLLAKSPDSRYQSAFGLKVIACAKRERDIYVICAG